MLLLGPRRTGKSAYLKHQLKADRSYDLLKSEVFRERLNERDRLVVIDEIQKLPQLMDEVHSLIEDRGIRFVLTGSSARKLRRTHTSLMAGRASDWSFIPSVMLRFPNSLSWNGLFSQSDSKEPSHGKRLQPASFTFSIVVF